MLGQSSYKYVAAWISTNYVKKKADLKILILTALWRPGVLQTGILNQGTISNLNIRNVKNKNKLFGSISS